MKTVASNNYLALMAFHFLGYKFMNDTRSNKYMMNVFHKTVTTVITITPRALLYPQLYNTELEMSKY